MNKLTSFIIATLLLASLAGLFRGCQTKPNQQSADPNEWRFALAMDGASAAKQPYPVLNGGAFDGPVVSESPDPLIGYRWKETKADDDLQVYTLRPVAAIADAKDAFGNLESATGVKTAITVKGTGSIRFDFGVESAAWLEFDSPDLAGNVEMSISEYNQPAVVNNGPEHPVKTTIPVKHGNTYRLELNSELYEGVRFGWIHVQSFTSQWHITGIRLVCQTKPTNYNGSFSCSDTMLTKIWYTGAYGVRLNLTKDYFGAILMDRGDRISWTGDAHPSQAASLVAFGNYDFVKKNIDNTSGQNNGIRSYSLYWVLSLIDYFNYTGDTITLKKYTDNASKKLDDALRSMEQTRNSGSTAGMSAWAQALNKIVARNRRTPIKCCRSGPGKSSHRPWAHWDGRTFAINTTVMQTQKSPCYGRTVSGIRVSACTRMRMLLQPVS